MQRYNPKEIEPKWQAIWDETGVYTTDLQTKKPKYLAMSMFNYPSGAGIHIGHAMNYTISDVKARFKRQQGFESYHPVGWDAFGLPAENYAIKAGVSPQESMATIIPGYHKQYKAMGWSNDWEKEIATHLPEYYKWTQWIFSEMFRNGLAYQDSRMQWWCEKDATVLANEQVIDGKCWRHDGPDDPLVEKKEIKQWFFKITDYADELLEATDALDWTESVKLAQKNWIGRKTGVEITYQIDNVAEPHDVTVFTTRPDTNFGATFIVISPEHELAVAIANGSLKAKDNVDRSQEAATYAKATAAKTEVERQQEGRKKTGAFTGLYAVNTLNNRRLPIWVADFVLAGFGTGAVVGVPGHDIRDFEFAKAFDLPVERVVVSADGDTSPITDASQVQEEDGKMVNSEFLNGLDIHEATEKMMDHMEAHGMGKRVVNYRMRDWSVSRQRYWGAPIPIIHCEKCGNVLVTDEQLPVVLPELDDFQPSGDGRSALARAKDWLSVDCPQCGGPAERETDTLDTYICSSWYMYRYMDPHNQQRAFDPEMAKHWEPVDFYNGADHATAHLLYARFIGHFFKKLGLVNEAEPFKQFVFNGKVVNTDGSMFSKSKGVVIDPLDIINQGYGADALRTYLMFAAPLELWTKWDPQGVPGTHRFLSRMWTLVGEYNEAGAIELTDEQQRAIRRSVHAMIRKMTEDIEANRYNTAIAASMTCVNELYKLKTSAFGQHEVWHEALAGLVACIAPFAPYIAEELWHQLGHSTSVHRDSWPTYDQQYLATDTINIAVQVNGKLRAEVQVPADATQEHVERAAKHSERVATYLADKEVKKTIYVPGRLLNFVIV
ncbi:MAG TPA: leucine--tRNA ligase [Candidatus Saccharimonadales bacterium]|nr:leucine--tRNA ligase [Candidatus Saccharimonadales bacterium]